MSECASNYASCLGIRRTLRQPSPGHVLRPGCTDQALVDERHPCTRFECRPPSAGASCLVVRRREHRLVLTTGMPPPELSRHFRHAKKNGTIIRNPTIASVSPGPERGSRSHRCLPSAQQRLHDDGDFGFPADPTRTLAEWTRVNASCASSICLSRGRAAAPVTSATADSSGGISSLLVALIPPWVAVVVQTLPLAYDEKARKRTHGTAVQGDLQVHSRKGERAETAEGEGTNESAEHRMAQEPSAWPRGRPISPNQRSTTHSTRLTAPIPAPPISPTVPCCGLSDRRGPGPVQSRDRWWGSDDSHACSSLPPAQRASGTKRSPAGLCPRVAGYPLQGSQRNNMSFPGIRLLDVVWAYRSRLVINWLLS